MSYTEENPDGIAAFQTKPSVSGDIHELTSKLASLREEERKRNARVSPSEDVRRLEAAYDQLAMLTGEILAMLRIERNRESIRRGEGVDKLFTLADRFHTQYLTIIGGVSLPDATSISDGTEDMTQ